MKRTSKSTAGLLAIAVVWFTCGAIAQVPAMPPCESSPQPAFCKAVRGERASGWAAQSRAEVMAQHGMVVASQPLAAQAGLQILMHGGNAIDAAVTTAAMLSLVEPMNVGIAGDLFAVIYIAKEHKVYVLNASGVAPTGATVERFHKLGYAWNPKNWGPGSGMPSYGILTVTVPGTIWGWDAALKRFGKLTFKEVLEPAAQYAEHGFPVSERIAHDWHLPNALPLERCCTQPDPDSIRTWYIDGRPPAPGQTFRNSELAHTLRLLQQQGADAFYKGEIARAIVAKSDTLGGTMTLDDLGNYKGEWVEAAASTYHDYDLFELPPPSQAWAANEILNILEICVPKWAPGQTLATLGPADAKYWHLMVEAKKLAYTDLFRYNADPCFATVPLTKLLSKQYAASLCAKVDPQHGSTPGPLANSDMSGDTIVLSTADAEGNMVSWVNSNFATFGSGITVPGYGFLLHNRGALFTLDAKSPNAIAAHKRPFNTLSAGFVMRGGQPVMTITLMGGDMQAQGHAQALVDIIDLGANLQAAADMARFRHNQIPNALSLETPLYNLVGAQLSAMGHTVRPTNGSEVGGVQIIMFTSEPTTTASTAADPMPHVSGFYRAGSDPRKDGQAVGW